jgi:hypothetical protein
VELKYEEINPMKTIRFLRKIPAKIARPKMVKKEIHY